MIRYVCDWCGQEFPRGEITSLEVSNVYGKGGRYHVCAGCGRVHMPDRMQSLLSWTSSGPAT